MTNQNSCMFQNRENISVTGAEVGQRVTSSSEPLTAHYEIDGT